MNEEHRQEFQQEELWAALPQTPPEKKPFQASKHEVIAALFSYLLPIVYVDGFANISGQQFILFTVLFTACGLLCYRDRIRQKEHWVWLGCLWFCLLCEILGRNRVWRYTTSLFLHAYAIYWILTLSGRLIDGRSSAWLPLDALNGLLYPLKYCFGFFRTRVLVWAIRRGMPKKEDSHANIIYILIAVLLAVVLFLCAGQLLIQADSRFGDFLGSMVPRISLENLEGRLLRLFFFELPIGAFLYGLIVGTGRETRASLDAKKQSCQTFLTDIRKVPNNLWTALTGIFVVLYLLFFWVQGGYLFGAFAGKLPEGFTVAEYARQGFFELCGIMALNFALLWLVNHSSVCAARENRPAKRMCTVLLSESLLFAATAMSKLVLYIITFGFTPLRLQSFWMICVLIVGCIAYLVSLWTNRSTVRFWIFFTGISLALLHVY